MNAIQIRSRERELCKGLALLFVLDAVHLVGSKLGVLDVTVAGLPVLDYLLHAGSIGMSVALGLWTLGLASARGGLRTFSWAFSLLCVVLPAFYAGLLWVTEGTNRGAAGWRSLPLVGSLLDVLGFATVALWPWTCLVSALLAAVCLERQPRQGALVQAAVFAVAVAACTWGAGVADWVFD